MPSVAGLCNMFVFSSFSRESTMLCVCVYYRLIVGFYTHVLSTGKLASVGSILSAQEISA